MSSWAERREIIEFSQKLQWYGANFNTYHFRKENNRWHWGYTVSVGIKWSEHPFATQREAKKAAEIWDRKKRSEVKEVISRMRKDKEKQGE